MSGDEFCPDWCVAPGECLRIWLEEKGLTVELFAAHACELDGMARPKTAEAVAMIEAVLAREPLTEPCARVLGRGTGTTAQFWLRFERAYREGLAEGLSDTAGLRNRDAAVAQVVEQPRDFAGQLVVLEPCLTLH